MAALWVLLLLLLLAAGCSLCLLFVLWLLDYVRQCAQQRAAREALASHALPQWRGIDLCEQPHMEKPGGSVDDSVREVGLLRPFARHNTGKLSCSLPSCTVLDDSAKEEALMAKVQEEWVRSWRAEAADGLAPPEGDGSSTPGSPAGLQASESHSASPVSPRVVANNTGTAGGNTGTAGGDAGAQESWRVSLSSTPPRAGANDAGAAVDDAGGQQGGRVSLSTWYDREEEARKVPRLTLTPRKGKVAETATARARQRSLTEWWLDGEKPPNTDTAQTKYYGLSPRGGSTNRSFRMGTGLLPSGPDGEAVEPLASASSDWSAGAAAAGSGKAAT